MKKKILLFVFAVCLISLTDTFSQKKHLKLPDHLKEAQLKPRPTDEISINEPSGLPYDQTALRSGTELPIGNTIYDLQTNGSMQDRFHHAEDGTLTAVWTMGFSDTAGYPDRGTGYVKFDGSAWGSLPAERLEDGIRTGWPSLNVLGDGSEVVINHFFATPYKVNVLRKEAGGTAWAQTDLPTQAEMGVLWPKSAVGGLDNMTIHAIAITTPLGLSGGALYNGVESQILYFRSTDGGVTWDKTDITIPGLDSANYCFFNADEYAIDAKENTVVIGNLSSFGDVALLRSDDNGETWEKTVVMEFPLNAYCYDSLYTADEIPGVPETENELAIASTDGSGAVLIDNLGKAHLWMGAMNVLDDAVDQNTQYFPGTSGMLYWNENFGVDSTQLIADLIDTNGDDSIAVADIALYFNSLTSYPSVGVDEANGIHLVYSALVEDFVDDVNDFQNYRHTFMISSFNAGETWGDPYDLINSDIVEEDIVPFVEAVYPAVARKIDDKIHLIYQQDFRPGLSVIGDEDEITFNNIAYVCLPTPVSSVENPEVELTNGKLWPNPAGDNAFLVFDLSKNAVVTISVFDIAGKLVQEINKGKLQRGHYSEIINLGTKTAGMYFVRINAGNESRSLKLILK